MYEGRPQGFDPYKPLDQGIYFSDVINHWALLRPRQRIVQLLTGQRVLDVCCGTGNLTSMLVDGGCLAVGVDGSPTMLSHARMKHIEAEFWQMDATQMLFDQEFDAAVISIALHEMPPLVRDMVWESMVRAVLPGGLLVALDFAVPLKKSLQGLIAGVLIKQDEKSMRRVHPEHYLNFQEFMRNGGLLPWVQSRSKSIEVEYRFWGGTLAILVTRKPGYMFHL